MGTQLVGPCVEDDSMEMASIPPGFESLVPFAVKRVEANNLLRPSSVSEPRVVQLETKNDSSSSKPCKAPRRRPGVKYNQIGSSSDDEFESEQDVFSRNRLPKGVFRGCETCKNCQKVTAKWRPREARRPDIENAPVFYPSEEEFEDTLKYIASIRPKAEIYGICRIVPPPSWRPPCPLKGMDIWEKSRFATRVQRIDKLQNRHSMRKILQVNKEKKKKKRRCLKAGADNVNAVQDTKITSGVELYDERFGFEPGPEFSLDTFEKYANDFKAQYFKRNDDDGAEEQQQQQPSIEEIEGEYWRMVEKPTEEIEVLYGADIETGSFGSGFPKNLHQVGSTDDAKYIQSGWNLNNFPKLPGSVLCFESSDISGVLIPWLYVGMCFSSFCWHVEDHHLYSLNYMHWGAPKMWYGVPGSDAQKFEAAMRKHLPDLFEEQPDLLHKLVTQISPSILKSERVPVYRCVQKPGEFVLTFPRAYHSGFNCGFNCAEAVNVAPIDWLPHGQKAIELYREQCRQTSISHDKLLLGAAREAVKANWECNLLKKHTPNNLRWKELCGKDGILLKAFKTRVEMERMRREMLCKSSQALKMESSFDANSERECSVCLFDLHLSAAGCHHCSPDKYACLNHARQLCSCSWGAKFFLFRYDISELNLLIEALGGKLSSAYRWARFDRELALSSFVSKEKQIPEKSPNPVHRAGSKETAIVQHVAKDRVEGGGVLNSMRYVGVNHFQNLKAPVVVLALENVKPLSSSQKAELNKNSSSSWKKEGLEQRFQTVSCKISEAKTVSPECSGTQKCEGNGNVILLSDDEEEGGSSGTAQKQVHNTAILGDKVSTNIVSDSLAMPEKQSNSVHINIEDSPETNAGSPSNSCAKSVDIKPVNVDCAPKQVTEDGKVKVEDQEMRLMETTPSVPNASGSQHSLDRYYRQKGPRIAKVVRRINCNVEALDFGTVWDRKSWCDSRAIYPKGFRSRVKYIDVVDPTNMCYYVSEIVDAGRDSPLFMVSVEHSPNEVFIHVSATRCWEMVRDRVNHEITKHHKLGKANLPPLQPPGSLDGIEMFGFSSPAIVQAIQAMDRNRVCKDYWKSRPLMQQIPEEVQTTGLNLKSEPLSDQDTAKNDDPQIERILNGLFKKADQEELGTLYRLLFNRHSTPDQSLLTRLLNEEINKHSR